MGFKYPVDNGRRYNAHWESDYCWLRYSRSKDAVFCAYCIVFGSNMHGSGSSSMEVFQQERRESLLSIIDTIVALGKRNIPFCGHNWNMETGREDGNFDFFIQWKSKFDPVLKSHLLHCKRNATYLSPTM